MIHLDIYGTGSSGNCYVINNKYMLDCGINIDALADANFDLQLNLEQIIISHAHGDHIGGLMLNNVYPNLKTIILPEIYLNKAYNVNLAQDVKPIVKKLYTNPLVNAKPTINDNWNEIVLTKFDVHHDIYDDGYVLKIDDKIILYATDIGDVNSVVLGYNVDENNHYTFYTYQDLQKQPNLAYKTFDLYLLECNYDLHVLEQNLQDALNGKPGAFSLKYLNRIKRGNAHLSSTDFQKCAVFNYNNKPMVLLHRSHQNMPFELNLPNGKKTITYDFLKPNMYVAFSGLTETYDPETTKKYHLVSQFDL